MWLGCYGTFENLGTIHDLCNFIPTAIENGTQQFPAARRVVCDQNSRLSVLLRVLTAIELSFHPTELTKTIEYRR